ncbi:unnamed protein product [Spirodela intermedia]|uniref:Uncharacterized protein n=1 Tax=Spirodela intermedia TaxID=51605 RepID=A0A7I8J1H9_SPIIN|nr:unnamed protein product [Spirodela intermedia]CAA6663822.1 unnamed protein product [Spirodela intermedia]
MALACLVCHVKDSPRGPSLSPAGAPPGSAGGPRLVRSLAVSRDLVRDWKFDENTPAEG